VNHAHTQPAALAAATTRPGAHALQRGAPAWAARAALVWLVLALAWVPTVGRLHQIAHAQPLAQIHAGHGTPGGVAQQHAPGHAAGFLGGFLSSHSLVDCLLLDQLALGDALHGAAVVLLPHSPAPAPAASQAHGVQARHAALFQARAPPPVLRA
jgi:hypothetical protein